eukprot:scaffold65_cov353-Prasinococcus_capsulatus_cf.AAC.18
MCKSGCPCILTAVREFPPRECCSKRVSLESRKGRWPLRRSPSLSVRITVPVTTEKPSKRN